MHLILMKGIVLSTASVMTPKLSSSVPFRFRTQLGYSDQRPFRLHLGILRTYLALCRVNAMYGARRSVNSDPLISLFLFPSPGSQWPGTLHMTMKESLAKHSSLGQWTTSMHHCHFPFCHCIVHLRKPDPLESSLADCPPECPPDIPKIVLTE